MAKNIRELERGTGMSRSEILKKLKPTHVVKEATETILDLERLVDDLNELLEQAVCPTCAKVGVEHPSDCEWCRDADRDPRPGGDGDVAVARAEHEHDRDPGARLR